MSLPRADSSRSTYLSTLAEAQYLRYGLTNENEDLEESISHSVEAILSFDPQIGHNSDVITDFFCLAGTLSERLAKLKRCGDSKHCLRYLRYLRDQSLETSHITGDRITMAFTHALANEVQMASIDSTQNIEELAILCHEFLRLDASDELLLVAAETLANTIKVGPFPEDSPPPDQAIECLREGNIRFPDSKMVSFRLLCALFHRFLVTYSHADYEDAMSIVDRSLTDLMPLYVKRVSYLAVGLARHRFSFYGKPEYLEEAIVRIRFHLRTMSSEDPERQGMTQDLEELQKARFRVDESSVAGSSRTADARNTEFDNHSSPPHLVSPLPTTRSGIVELTPMTRDVGDPLGLNTLLRLLDQATDLAGIEEAMEHCRRILELSRSNNMFTVVHSHHLAKLLIGAFSYTDDMAYVDESITLLRGVLKGPVIVPVRLKMIQDLILALSVRFLRFSETADIEEIMQLYSTAAAQTYADLPDRFRMSCHWAMLVWSYRHLSTSTAYGSAISLMKDSLAFSPTLEMQHNRLVSMRVEYETLPLGFASHQIEIGQLEQAIETLERGRGLLWSEMRSLRMSIDQLRLVNLPLAERFAAINNDLEALTTSSPAAFWPNEGQVDSDELMDPIGWLVIKQRALVTERNTLISQIQSLPGFGTFLITPSFNILRSAAEQGLVIIINHMEQHSDIIILLRDAPPSLIPAPDNFYKHANQLKGQLLGARNHGLESDAYDDALSSILESLYDLVGCPVIKRLRELGILEQSRIWFCPTSVFCSLPLHAMGPIRSEGPVKSYFSDLYIPSYTPTLSALIESRKPRAQPLDWPSILLVIQPDAKMPKALQEMRVIQSVGLSTVTLLRGMATPSTVLEHLKHYPFVHVSCHGDLKTGKPFDAFFKLYEGSCLTLLDIVRARLPTAEFAFLSACHTAEHTTGSIMDEGLHLAGAVQYCGFRSVVGTIWKMADVDGPDLAGNFYGSVFSNRWGGIPHYKRTAEALRDAVKVLRRKRKMTLERWVNFVHYGA